MVNLSSVKQAENYQPCREFKVGDRVIRQRTVGNAKLGFYHGEIIKIRPRFGACSLADVRWDADTTTVDTGYLVSQLNPETFD